MQSIIFQFIRQIIAVRKTLVRKRSFTSFSLALKYRAKPFSSLSSSVYLSGVTHLLTPLIACVPFPPQLSVTMALQMLSPPTLTAFVSTVLSVLSLTLLLLLCVIRKKRRMEGTYKPSAEEKKQTRSAGSEKPGLTLPMPKEERLI